MGVVIAVLRGPMLRRAAEIVEHKAHVEDLQKLLNDVERRIKKSSARSVVSLPALGAASLSEDEEPDPCTEISIEIYEKTQAYLAAVKLYEEFFLSMIIMGLYDPTTGEFSPPTAQEVVYLTWLAYEIIRLHLELNILASQYSLNNCWNEQ